MKNRKDVWPPERIEKMLALLAQNKSSEEIAKALGEGATRNAVLGKIHRLVNAGKLERPRAPDAPPKAAKPKPDPAVAKVHRVLARHHRISHGFGAGAVPTVPVPPRELKKTKYDAIDPATPGLLRMLDLKPHHCRWPLNNALGGEYYFCGDQRQSGKPYCEVHTALAYQPNPRKKIGHGAA